MIFSNRRRRASCDVTQRLTPMAQVLVPCWNKMHVRIFESWHLEGSYVGDLLYFVPTLFSLYTFPSVFRSLFLTSTLRSSPCFLQTRPGEKDIGFLPLPFSSTPWTERSWLQFSLQKPRLLLKLILVQGTFSERRKRQTQSCPQAERVASVQVYLHIESSPSTHTPLAKSLPPLDSRFRTWKVLREYHLSYILRNASSNNFLTPRKQFRHSGTWKIFKSELLFLADVSKIALNQIHEFSLTEVTNSFVSNQAI